MNEEDKILIIKKLEDVVSKQEKTIKMLEDKITSQNIVINALILQVKNQKNTSDINVENTELIRKINISDNSVKKMNIFDETVKRIHISEEPGKMLSVSEEPEKILNILEESGKVMEVMPVKNSNNNGDINVNYQELENDIKNIFVHKQKMADFKMNFCFKKFVEYAESYYEFLLTNKKISKLKNPFKLYIESNLDKIIKYLIDNINYLNLNQICSSLFMITYAIEYDHKLVIAHDILLEINNYTKLPFIFSALFNNIELRKDSISLLINKILYHQYCIDTDIFNDEIILGYFEIIKNNFDLEKPRVSLWKSLSDYLVPVTLFKSIRNVIQITNVAMENGYGLRILATYLDWDYTYNEFIVNMLSKAHKSNSQPIYIYYMGILAINALRMFGMTESVILILETISEYMIGCDECSIAAFLIVKQVFDDKAYVWLEKNKNSLSSQNIPVDLLKTLLIL